MNAFLVVVISRQFLERAASVDFLPNEVGRQNQSYAHHAYDSKNSGVYEGVWETYEGKAQVYVSMHG